MTVQRRSCSFFAAVFVFTLLGMFSASVCFGGELEEIRSMIKAKGHKWEAGETSVSKLSVAERKARCGHLKPQTTVSIPATSSEGSVAALPGTLDWRTMNGQNFVTSVKDQGGCGSCWAFATTAALESYILVKDSLPAVDDNRAEEILVSCSGAGSCNGGYIGSASEFIRGTGLPPELFMPYTATSTDNTCSRAVSGWQDNTYRIGTWSYVTTSSVSISAIKNALVSGPLVTTFDVYNDFFSYTGGIYEYATGSLAGGHAVLLVGYTDDATVNGGGYFLVKNSWGAGWGEGGYFRIAYSQAASPVGFGEYTIAYGQPATPPAAPTSLTATAASSSNSIALTWSDNASNESGYKIERCAGSGCSNFAQIATVSSNVTSYTNSGLAASTAYTYRVRAYNSGGDSGYSNVATATTPAQPAVPASPTNLSATAISKTQINLSWTDNAVNEDGFNIERCTGATCTKFAKIAMVGANITVYNNNTGLRKGTTYRYRLSAYNGGGTSTYSNIATVTTPR